MTSSIEIVVDAVDADAAAGFWKEALGYERLFERGAYTALGPPEGDPRPRLLIQRVDVVTPGRTGAVRTGQPERPASGQGVGADLWFQAGHRGLPGRPDHRVHRIEWR